MKRNDLLKKPQRETLVLVVGFDGTPASERALQRAAEMLIESTGRMEIVNVSHVPELTGLSGQAMTGLDNLEHKLVDRVEEVLRPKGVKWNFQWRNGDTADELLNASDESLASEDPHAHVILVLGGSEHKVRAYLNSTPAKVMRKDRLFDILVVP